ncbi:MAG: hypothetical protein PHW04_13885 [Candidatus Wallbacteria bacterium]|nr:hypothetical protein [Candidatus Wallbacteria bacterium]
MDEVLRAKRIELTDSQGKPRIVLSVDSHDRPVCEIRDKLQEVRFKIALGVGDLPEISMSGRKYPESGVTVGFDSNEQPCLKIQGKDKTSYIRLHFEEVNPRLTFEGNKGESCIWLRIDKDGKTKLSMTSEEDFWEIPTSINAEVEAHKKSDKDKKESLDKDQKKTSNPFFSVPDRKER